jgi:AcrR family transcriptional regulator
VTTLATVSERKPITLDAIAGAGLVIVDREGLGALTMRRLAAELQVEAPSLYHHVRGKEAVLDLVAVHVLNQAPLLASRARTPKGRVRDLVLAYREAMLEHPNVFALLMQLTAERSGLLNSAHAILAELRGSGLSDRVARERNQHIAAYVTGWIGTEIAGGKAGRHSTLELPELDLRTFLDGLELLLA